jgi:hypothetical protein
LAPAVDLTVAGPVIADAGIVILIARVRRVRSTGWS